MMKHKPVILHIGTEKTGTTFLQEFLRTNQRKLLEQGLVYPTSVPHHSIPLCISQNQPELARNMSLLGAEIEEHDKASRVLLSSEFCHSRMTSKSQLATLENSLRYIGLAVTEIFVYFRDQSSLFHSSYSELIKAGVSYTFDEMFQLMKGQPYYSHLTIARLWADHFTPERIRIFSYNTHKADLLQHFLSVIKINKRDGFFVPSRLNKRPSPLVLEIVRGINKLGKVDAVALTNFLSRADAFSHYSLLSEANAAEIREIFDEQNQALCREFGLSRKEFPAIADEERGCQPNLSEEILNLIKNFWLLRSNPTFPR